MSKQIVVAGDAMIDWNLTVERDVSVASRSWREAGKVRSLRQLGGAWLLKDLVREFAVKTAYRRKVFGPKAPGANTEAHHQTYTILERATDEVWRIKEFLGVRKSDKAVDPDLKRNPPSADLVLLLDSDLGFDRTKSPAWPEAIRTRRHQPWIIFKSSVPAFEAPLWRHLIARHKQKLIVVMTVEDLRRKGVQMLRRLSWERAAHDLVSEVRESPALRELNECEHIIVSFGTAGAVLIPREDSPRLVFDPAAMEGEWEPTVKAASGMMIGYTTVLTAALAHEVMLQPNEPQLIDAVARGIAGMRAMFKCGFGDGKEPVVITKPIVKAALAPGAADFVSTAAISLQKTPGWTILGDRIKHAATISPNRDADEVLYELAARAAVFGPESALADVPQLRINNLFSVDRDEIESLRSIKELLSEYVQRKPSKPFSIAVFGSPGSGKSFAVEEIARRVGGDRITLLTFNLSQFAHSDDLHGAFHQVRDVSLRGKIPIVFWDEFDTTYDGETLGWLRYFIGPMQDGLFQQDQITHPIGTSVFVFAGGTATTKEKFVNPDRVRGQKMLTEAERKARKVPDFISRLKGFLDVGGPNPRESGNDAHYLIRRAILLRALIFKHCPDLFLRDGATQILQIDPGVLHAFLTTEHYRHGARSLESVISMSALAGRKHFDSSSLPPEPQLELHVKLPFEQLAQEFKFTDDVVLLEQLAEMAHDTFWEAKKAAGWTPNIRRNDDVKVKHHDLMKPYAQLRESDKARNRATVRWIPSKVAAEGYDIALSGSGESQTLSPAEKERLAKREHEIWMANKRAAGYEWGPNPSESPKRSPYLVPWKKLRADFQDVDRAMVEAIPKILEKAQRILVKKKRKPKKKP